MRSASGLVSVVDDDLSVRESLADFLRSHGFQVEAFSSAEDFLAFENAKLTSCLLLDLTMPGMSGLALQEELSKRAWEIPIVIVSSRLDGTAKARALEGGAVAYVVKPFSSTTILEAVTAALAKPREGPGQGSFLQR